MWGLMRLEMKKFKLGWYVRGAITANLLVIILLVLIGYVEKGEDVAFVSIEEAFIVIGALVRAIFIIFASVLIAKLIIEEYKNKTISVLFTYPIKRKKLIAAKLAIVGIATFITTLLSNFFVVAVFFIFNSKLNLVPGELSLDIMIKQSVSIITFAIAITGTSLIPLYFGMRKKSVPATIVSSIIIVMLIGSHNPAFSVASIVYVPLFLAVIGVFIAYRAIRDIDKVDVL